MVHSNESLSLSWLDRKGYERPGLRQKYVNCVKNINSNWLTLMYRRWASNRCGWSRLNNNNNHKICFWKTFTHFAFRILHFVFYRSQFNSIVFLFIWSPSTVYGLPKLPHTFYGCIMTLMYFGQIHLFNICLDSSRVFLKHIVLTHNLTN